MHVHAAQHVALADHLQVIHHDVVAFVRSLPELRQSRGRMRAGGKDGEPMLGRNRSDRLAQRAQFVARGRDVVMR